MSFNETLNTTNPVLHPNAIDTKLKEITICLILVLICLIGLVGNGIIMWLLYFRIKRNESSVYILNLALADYLYLLGCGMFSVYLLCLLNGVKTSKSTDKVFSNSQELIINFGFSSSLFLLATLSTERCMLVCFPIWYKCQRPEHLSAIICGIIWVLCLFIVVVERFLFPAHRPIVYIVTSVLFLIVVLFMVFSSIVLLFEVQKTPSCFRPVKLYIVIIAAVICFLISCVPNRVIRILFFFAIIPTSTMKTISFLIISLCSAINACANPYIYILVGRWRNSSSIQLDLEKVFKEEVASSNDEETIPGRSSD